MNPTCHTKQITTGIRPIKSNGFVDGMIGNYTEGKKVDADARLFRFQ